MLIVHPRGARLNPAADVWIDVVEFEDRLLPFEKAAAISNREQSLGIEEAVALYRGHLLEGPYDGWCLEARERLHTLLTSSLEKLLAFYQLEGDWLAAIAYGKELLRHDPLNEHAHRSLMECYWQLRDRVAAMRQYNRCADVLSHELGVPPMPETAALYREIKTA